MVHAEDKLKRNGDGGEGGGGSVDNGLGGATTDIAAPPANSTSNSSSRDGSANSKVRVSICGSVCVSVWISLNMFKSR